MSDLSSVLEIFLITFNRKKYLEETLKKIFSEDSPIRSLRITILDNKSTDGTSELINEYAEKNPNIVHVINNRNIGGNANICKCYELATYKYFWILCDDDEYNWTYWNDVTTAINDDSDAIVVANYAHPGNNIAQLLCQLSFVPAAIYKTENISDTIMVNAEYQISTMFPQLALVCKLVNDKKNITIIDNWIVNMVIHNSESSYVRGLNNDRNPLLSNTTWSLGFLKSIQMIQSTKERRFIVKSLTMPDGEKILHPEYFFKYNKTIGNSSRINLFTYYSMLPLYRFRFILQSIFFLTERSVCYLKKEIKRTRIGKKLLKIKHFIEKKGEKK
jgi:glycosyltransferase involved in cell wall biosynthesis